MRKEYRRRVRYARLCNEALDEAKDSKQTAEYIAIFQAESPEGDSAIKQTECPDRPMIMS